MGIKELLELKGIGRKTAQSLVEAGFFTIDDIAHASIEDLTAAEGIGTSRAHHLKKQASDFMSKQVTDSNEGLTHKRTIEARPSSPFTADIPHKTEYSHTHKHPSHKTKTTIPIVFIAAIFVTGLVIGSVASNMLVSQELSDVQNNYDILKEQLQIMQPLQNVTYLFGNISLSELYNEVSQSVVFINGYTVQYTIFGPIYSEVGGSGFIYNASGKKVIITNNHVVEDTINISVTLQNGNAYSAEILGSDPYADLAVLEIIGETDMLKPLNITSSSTLNVGDPVIAIGNPFRLSGSMTTGIVSQLGRTIQESAAGSFSIANIIQISTPINPGNSGGPLLNYHGDVVGITTAIIVDSQGVGFAVPSNTMIKEIPSLVATGSYTQHSWIGVTGVDKSYDIAQAMGVNTTYGWLIASVVDGGPADDADLRGSTSQVQIGGAWKPIGGDVIVAIDGTTIVTGDDMMSYLEGHTLPGQTIDITVIRNNQYLTVPMELGVRPSPAT